MKCQFKGHVVIMRTVMFKNVVTFQQESLNAEGAQMRESWVRLLFFSCDICDSEGGDL
jgi:hypothetical protein